MRLLIAATVGAALMIGLAEQPQCRRADRDGDAKRAIAPDDGSTRSSPSPVSSRSESAAEINTGDDVPVSSGFAAGTITGEVIPWNSVNPGGRTMSSIGYRMKSSAGQTGVGRFRGWSPNYRLGAGYWFGPDRVCACPHQGDVAPTASGGDGVVDVLDIVAAIEYVFRSGPPLPTDEPICPRPRADLAPSSPSCGDGEIDVLDVVALIDHVFRSGPPPCDPCA